MIELQHRAGIPPSLTQYLEANPAPLPDKFDSPDFQPIKQDVKRCLNEDQGGLCAYCESHLSAHEGQIDHIKPRHHRRDLVFSYTNYAHSCINDRTCGQKKKNGLLPIEPGPGCNDHFYLTTDGYLEPIPGITRHQKHLVRQTRDMLGLQQAALVEERHKWIIASLEIMRNFPDLLPEFLADKPFRHILKRLSE